MINPTDKKDVMKNLTSAQRTLMMSVVLFLAMIGLAVFNEDGILTAHKFQKELDTLEQRNKLLQEENSRIKLKIERLKTDPFAIEMIAREKLNLVRPQEIVYQIVHEPQDPETHP